MKNNYLFGSGLVGLRLAKSYSDVLFNIKKYFKISDIPYAICDGDDKLQKHLKENGYQIQKCTNHFIKTSMY